MMRKRPLMVGRKEASGVDMADKLPDPRHGAGEGWPPKEKRWLFRGMLLGMISKNREAMRTRREWSVHTGIPVVKKTITAMRSDNKPIRETVQIGAVHIVFAGSQLVGFAKGDTKLMLPSMRAQGLDWPQAETMSELVKRLYLALGEETTSMVDEWVDKDLS